jgi:hypothetical protein
MYRIPDPPPRTSSQSTARQAANAIITKLTSWAQRWPNTYPSVRRGLFCLSISLCAVYSKKKFIWGLKFGKSNHPILKGILKVLLRNSLILNRAIRQWSMVRQFFYQFTLLLIVIHHAHTCMQSRMSAIGTRISGCISGMFIIWLGWHFIFLSLRSDTNKTSSINCSVRVDQRRTYAMAAFRSTSEMRRQIALCICYILNIAWPCYFAVPNLWRHMRNLVSFAVLL